MDFAALAPGLLDVAASLTGVPRTCCQWQNEPRVQHNGSLVLLRHVSEVSVGVDAVDYAFAANADPLLEMTPTVSGNRVLVVQIDVEVHNQLPGVNAHALVSRARTRLRWPSTLAALEALGLALVGAEQVVVTDYEDDNGRMISRRSMDVRFNAVATEVDLDGRTSYIATVGTIATMSPTVAASISPGGTLP